MPYNVSNSSRKYWPDLDLSQRIVRLLGELREIDKALGNAFGATALQLPQPSQVSTLWALKRYEDALDALVCAWVGCQYVEGTAVAYGDDSSAIWVPAERQAAQIGPLLHG